MIKDKKLFMKIKLPNAKASLRELTLPERNKQLSRIGNYYSTLRIYIVDRENTKKLSNITAVYFKDRTSKTKYRSEIFCRKHAIMFNTATFPEYSDNEKASIITNFNGNNVNISLFDIVNTLTTMKTDLFHYVDGQFMLRDSRYHFEYTLSKSK